MSIRMRLIKILELINLDFKIWKILNKVHFKVNNLLFSVIIIITTILSTKILKKKIHLIKIISFFNLLISDTFIVLILLNFSNKIAKK